jgi:hypothetical protein
VTECDSEMMSSGTICDIWEADQDGYFCFTLLLEFKIEISLNCPVYCLTFYQIEMNTVSLFYTAIYILYIGFIDLFCVLFDIKKKKLILQNYFIFPYQVLSYNINNFFSPSFLNQSNDGCVFLAMTMFDTVFQVRKTS